jgi:hypothetical protein
MSEVLVQFETLVAGVNGSRWAPRACGRARADGLWESWIEFEPLSPSDGPLRTSRESLQPNRDDLMYWAQGLTQSYLEGALHRAVGPEVANGNTQNTAGVSAPDFGAPADATVSRAESVNPRAVLNPFEVWQQGEHVLVRQLAALNSARLRDIAVAYGFATRQAIADETTENLVATILDGVQNRRGESQQRD